LRRSRVSKATRRTENSGLNNQRIQAGDQETELRDFDPPAGRV
jgi:hypothetical protein